MQTQSRFPNRTAIILALLASACTTSTSGRWVGTLTPSTPGPNCAPSRAVADINAGAVLFAPDEGTWLLRGKTTPDGKVTAERTQAGADKRPYITSLQATLTPDALAGTYTTPRCTFAVAMKRN